MRDFGDHAAARAAIYDRTLQAARSLKPVSNSRYSLGVENVDYEDPDEYPLTKQKDAILKGGTLYRRLRGDWVLKDLEGKELDRQRMTLAQVPWLTQQGAFILNGRKYGLGNQLRLRAGAFARVKDNGEIESHSNHLPGRGVSHRYTMEPETGVFKMQFAQSNLPLFSVLKALGKTESELRQAWGNELYEANAKKDDPRVVDRLYQRLVRRGKADATDADKAAAVKQALERMEYDPEINKRHLGQPYERLNADAMMAIAAKMLAVSRGEAEPDDRDHPANQHLMGPEDLIAERLERPGSILHQLLWKASTHGNLKRLPINAFDRHVKAAILDSGVGQYMTEINPLEVLDQSFKITRMGVGAMQSLDAIPSEARSVQPAQIGFIDPVFSPESFRAGVDARVAYGAKKGSDGRLYAPFTNPKTGETIYKSPQDVADLTLAFPHEPVEDRYIKALVKGRLRYVDRNKVDLVMPHPEQWFGSTSNLVFAKNASKGQRDSMGARFVIQALPLSRGEAPLVRNQVVGQPGKSFEELYGKQAGAVHADQAGRVVAVTPDGIKVRYQDGTTKTHELYNHHPFNQKTALHNTPVVQPGDEVQPNQLLARSNFTDDKGHLAAGLNARVAFMPFRGLNHLDAFVISKSFADRLTSEHLYQHALDLDDKTRLGKKQYVAMFASKFPRQTLDMMDDHGVIKPGSIVKHGDPLILAAAEKPATHKSIHAGHKASFADQSVLWDHHDDGVVTDVSHTPKGVVVAVKSLQQMKIGDKLCYDPETDVLTAGGWKNITEVGLGDRVASLNPATGELEYLRPDALHAYDHAGKMYRLETTQVDLLVTDNHKLYAKPRYATTYGLYEAQELFGKRYRMQRNACWGGVTPPDCVELPKMLVRAGQHGNGWRWLPPVAVPSQTYLMLLGMHLAEGNLLNQPRSGTYGFEITQVKPHSRAKMLAALRDAAVSFTETGDKVRIHGKQWLDHLLNFGRYQHERRIPSFVFDWDAASLQTLFNWLIWGDGSVGKTQTTYTTTSAGLAGDLQRLCLHLGVSANVHLTPPRMGIIKGREYQFRARYDVSVFAVKNCPEINHGHCKSQGGQLEEWVDYAGKVYCVTLPRNHVLYVRRNGKPVWCGNSGRHGNKGVISSIVDDEEMPKDAQGRPFEVLANPTGTISRANASQKAELWLGKIAAATGKPYVLEDFAPRDLMEFVEQELAKHKMTGMEDVTDPTTGRTVKVATGMQHVMKLHHQSESKHHGRGIGGYTAEDTPARGGSEGSKRVAMMDVSSLLSSGATEVLRDARLIKGQKNPNYWSTFMSGFRPATPQVPLVYRKFHDQLRAAGINVQREGSKLHLFALTDKDVDQLAENRELKSMETVDWKDGMKPVQGGLFSTDLTGGHGGCFHPSVTIWTEHGPLTIGQIVQEQLAVKVWSYNFETSTFELKPITGWFRNHAPEGIGRAVFKSGACGRLSGHMAYYNPTTLWGTRGHQVYSLDGRKQDLANATQLTFAVEQLSYSQQQLLYGTALGDGHVAATGQYAACHGKRQAGYLRLKHAILSPLCANEPEEFVDASDGMIREKVRFVSRAHDAFREARKLCYVGNRKTLSQAWLDRIDVMGLAFWFFDDGSVHRKVDKNTVYITMCTECFSKDEVEMLRDWLVSRWGLQGAWLNRDHSKYGERDCGWQIMLSGDTAWRLLDLVAPYADASVAYKFPGRPKTKRCPCGAEIAMPRRSCNACQLAKAAACGAGKLPKDVRRLFGGTAAVRKMLACDVVPADDLRLGAWECMSARIGIAVAAMRADIELRMALRDEPVQFAWNTGARWESTQTVFDIEVEGNHNYFANGVLVSNSKWSHFPLVEPMPSPVYEDPIRHMLGLTGKQFEDVLFGRAKLDGKTGPAAIQSALAGINVKQAIANARADIQGTRKGKRDEAIRRLGYLKALEKQGIEPKDWMLSKVPVIPPIFRPVSQMQTGQTLVADANLLYKEAWDANQNLKAIRDRVADISEERQTLYNALKAVTGLGDPVQPKNRERGVSGFLANVFGSSPKYSVLQQKLLGTPVDLVGRAVVSPNPDLSIDEAGIPEPRAWEVYSPFIVRRLVRQGIPHVRAVEAVDKRDKLARKALIDEMDARPVIINRAPVLHRYGRMAFFPRLVKGAVLQVSPLITKGMGMDFNGDSCRSPLIPVKVSGKLFVGSFEQFIKEYLMPNFQEDQAVATLGCQTTVLELLADTVEVPSADMNGIVAWRPVKCLSIHTSHGPDCFNVTTSRGLDAVFTAHHNFLALDESCRLVAVKTEAVKSGSLLPVIFGFDTTCESTVADGRPTLPLTFDSGFWLGHYVGDGSITGRGDTLSLASVDSELLDYLERVGELFSSKRPWREGNGNSSRWTDVSLVQWISGQFGAMCDGVRIPGWVFLAPRAFRLGILAGFMAAEGSVGTQAAIEVANRTLCLSVQMLASTLGISSRVSPGRPARKSKVTSSTLLPTTIIRFNSLTLAAAKIPWPECATTRKMLGVTGSRTRQVWDMVPYPAIVADYIDKEILAHQGGRGKKSRKTGRKPSSYLGWKTRKAARTAARCTRRLALAAIEHCGLRTPNVPEAVRNWVGLVDNQHLIWDTVKKVEKTDRPLVTYDWHVPGAETFCVDGFFLTHNTSNYEVPASDEAATEALYKMLPSRNLVAVADFKKPVPSPQEDYIAGIHAATHASNSRRPRVFANKAAALQAWWRGELHPGDPVEIHE